MNCDDEFIVSSKRSKEGAQDFQRITYSLSSGTVGSLLKGVLPKASFLGLPLGLVIILSSFGNLQAYLVACLQL